ncbi:2-hydroxychromene-2-carboxylate isomerase [Magnetospira thiophila]
MSKTITYYCALISPFTYFGQPRIMALGQRPDVELVYRPIDLLKIFPVTGTLPPSKRHPSVQAYRLTELRRWSAELNLPLNLKPKHFPIPTDLAGAMVIAARDQGADVGPLVMGMLRGVWAEEADLADAATLTRIAEGAGLNGAALAAQAATPEAQAKFAASTEEAMAAGVFGSPTLVIDGEMFWGQDRIALAAKKLG